jgi:hypothetical protein
MPVIRQTVRAQAVIFIVEPGIWIVAQRGIVKLATSSLQPVLTDWRRVTGMVAAEDDVPSAVR